MKNYFGLLLVIFTATSCTTYQTKSENVEQLPKDRTFAFQEKNDKNSAEIILIRDQGLAASTCYYAVFIDQKLAARIDVAEKATFYLEPGIRKLKITRDKESKGLCADGKDEVEKEIALNPDEVQKYRLTLELSGQPSLNTYME